MAVTMYVVSYSLYIYRSGGSDVSDLVKCTGLSQPGTHKRHKVAQIIIIAASS